MKFLGWLGILGALMSVAVLFLNDWIGGYTSVWLSDFTVEQIPDLHGKVALVTGANTGIGKVTAIELARKGAHVIFSVRSEEKGVKALASMKESLGEEAKLEFGVMDLGSLASVRSFAEWFLAKELPLHIAIFNAGIMACPYGTTSDGFETQFGVNHMGHFYLHKLLESTLKASAPSREVVVSSLAHFFAADGIQFNSLKSDEGYSEMGSYGQSKLANVLFAVEAASRLNGTGVSVNAVHPGAIATDLGRHLEAKMSEAAKAAIKSVSDTILSMRPEQGALTQLYVATMPAGAQTGLYFRPVGRVQTPSKHAFDEAQRKKLWEVSEQFVAEFEAKD